MLRQDYPVSALGWVWQLESALECLRVSRLVLVSAYPSEWDSVSGSQQL